MFIDNEKNNFEFISGNHFLVTCSQHHYTTCTYFWLLYISVCNFGQEWEVADIHTVTQYRAGLREEIEADIGVKIGLRSVNITLKGESQNASELALGPTPKQYNFHSNCADSD